MTFNELIAKIGIDKILYFSIGGLITALLTIVAILQEDTVNATTLEFPFMGLIPIAMFSWFKIVVLEDELSWTNILASVLGAVPVFIATALGVLFHILSN